MVFRILANRVFLFYMKRLDWTYLKLTGIKVGLMINFDVVLMKDGIKRIVRDLCVQTTHKIINSTPQTVSNGASHVSLINECFLPC